MPALYNDVGVNTSTVGTGTMTLGTALNSTYLTEVEGGFANGDVVSYVISDSGDIEGGYGTYTSAGRLFSRDTVIFSKISGVAGTSKINLSGQAQVRFTMLIGD